jgi:phosphoribosylformylglycinamidine synthase
MVQTNTVLLPGAGAAVLRIRGSKTGLAMTLDGNGRVTKLDPRTGGMAAVAEACRNLACVGAKPIGVTNCLNFGNPEKPGVMGQFKEAVEGLGEACEAFGIAVTGGNVSFYNETEGIAIDPTPVLGIVGLVEDVEKIVTPGFKAEGDAVILLGENREEFGGSEYLNLIHGTNEGALPVLNLGREIAVQETLLEAIAEGLVRSAQDPSEGGLAVCAAECAFHSRDRIGCDLDFGSNLRPDAVLFGEAPSRVLITVRPDDVERTLELARARGVVATMVGTTGGASIKVKHLGNVLLDLPVAAARGLWMEAIPAYFPAAKS